LLLSFHFVPNLIFRDLDFSAIFLNQFTLVKYLFQTGFVTKLYITSFTNVKVRCLEDPEMEEYVDELEGLVESLSDDEHVEKEHIFTEQFYGQCTHHARRDDRQKTFYVINHSEVENAKSQSLLQSFQAQLESDIIEMIVVHQNGDGLIIFPEYNESI
ncbi:hypothetical protein T10_10754, partial [Trichinella papuae]